ncbi:hypothetical protein BMS3Abin16_01153 [archaeon BMS3Abin16]|nr:hypothetical protein BMS3Abin16_01153 [archaeon BMS3Abin16]
MFLINMIGSSRDNVVVQPTEKVNQPSETVTQTIPQSQIQEQTKPKIRSATLSVDRVVESVANLGKIRITVTNTGEISINPNFDVTVIDSEGKAVCEDSPMFGVGSIESGKSKTDEIQILSCIFNKDGDYTVKVDLLDKEFNKLDTDSKTLTVNYWNLLGGEAPKL